MEDKRKRVVELITTCLERDSLLKKQKTKAKMLIHNMFYEKVKTEGNWNALLEMYIKSLGLSFALVALNLEDYDSPLCESNHQEIPWKTWERLISGNSRLSQKLQEERQQRRADLEKIVRAVQTGTTKEALNRAIELAAPLYKIYGEIWLDELRQALSVNVKSAIVQQFIGYVKNKSDEIVHLKEAKQAKKKTTAKEYSKELSAKEAKGKK